MEQVVVLTLFMILIVSLYIASFVMIVSLKNWMTKRDEFYTQKMEYYEQKIKYNEEAFTILKDVKNILNKLNNYNNGTRNEFMEKAGE